MRMLGPNRKAGYSTSGLTHSSKRVFSLVFCYLFFYVLENIISTFAWSFNDENAWAKQKGRLTSGLTHSSKRVFSLVFCYLFFYVLEKSRLFSSVSRAGFQNYRASFRLIFKPFQTFPLWPFVVIWKMKWSRSHFLVAKFVLIHCIHCDLW